MTDPTPTGLSDNGAGALAYFTIVPAIVFLVLPPYNASSYVRFHAWQSIFLNVAAIVVFVAFSILAMFGFIVGFHFYFLFLFRMLIWLGFFIVWLICVLKAVNGERYKLPVIGDLAAKQAGS